MLTPYQIQHYKTQGYVLIDPAVPAGMLTPLRAAAGRLTERTRRGEWPHKRRAGEDDIWGVSHLLHPDVGEPVFGAYMASPVVLEVVADLLGVSPEPGDTPLQLELVNMLVNPAQRDHQIGWHRDLVSTELPPEEERAALLEIQHGVQWNTALYDEACLHIVPGSHVRASTQEERDIVKNRPCDLMPGQMAVELKAGQGVYYNANLLHRGVYARDRRRETLHACMGTVHGALMRKNLYTWLSWMTDPAVRNTLPPGLHPLYDNFLRMAKTVMSDE
jgi:hypothetical protein